MEILLAAAPSQILSDIASALGGAYQTVAGWFGRQLGLLAFTDPAATYDNPSVKELWGLSLIISDSILAILIVLCGYRIMFSGFGSRYSEALEELPRLITVAIGANASLMFSKLWIDLNDALCALLTSVLDK